MSCMNTSLVFLVFIILLENYPIFSISFRGGDSPELFQYCEKYSNCNKSSKCQKDMAKCQDCVDMQQNYWTKSLDFNVKKYECYKNCMEKKKLHERKSKTLTEIQDFYYCLDFKINHLPNPQFQEHKKFYVPKINLIAKIFKKKGWTQIDDHTDLDWDFKWVYWYKHINYNEDRKDQIASKTQDFQKFLGDKIGLIHTLRNFDKISNFKMKSTKFFPKSYIIDYSQEHPNQEENKLYQDKDEYWIIKNPEGKGGEGITIKKTMEEVQNFISQNKKIFLNDILKESDGENKIQNSKPVDLNAVVQRYISTPSLLNKKKYDIRSFVLIASTDPLVILYKPGFFGLSYEDFDLVIEPFDDEAKIKHLTNSKQQSKHQNWNDPSYRNSHRREIKSGFRQMKEQYSIREKQLANIKKNMKNIAAYTYLAAFNNTEYERKPFEFHFTAIDYMLDDQNNVYLLEANSDPMVRLGFGKANTAQPLITAIDVVLQVLQIKDIEERRRLLSNLQKYIDLAGWEILYNEASGENILDL